MKQVVVRPAAATDIEDAYERYESQQPGLGDKFLAVLRTARDRLLEHPEAYPSCTATPVALSFPDAFPTPCSIAPYGDG